MKKLIIFAVVLIMGCSLGPQRQDYQVFMSERVESPFFYVPPLNQKDFENRTWILLAESQSKLWFYDPYTLKEDEDGIISYVAFFKPRQQNNLAAYNATLVGPYLQKIDCFSGNQWSETLYTQNIVFQGPLVGDAKPVNGSGWVKIAPKTAMDYVRARLCGRKFLDEQNVHFFLYQDGFLPMPFDKTPAAISKVNAENSGTPKIPLVYEVINNEVIVVDATKDIRQMRMVTHSLEKYFPKKAEYLFTANCQNNSFILAPQGSGEKLSSNIGARDSLAAVALNRACGDHGSYMKLVTKLSK
jgi:hypothetical protein